MSLDRFPHSGRERIQSERLDVLDPRCSSASKGAVGRVLALSRAAVAQTFSATRRWLLFH